MPGSPISTTNSDGLNRISTWWGRYGPIPIEAAAYVTDRELTQTFDFDLSTAILNSVNSRNANSINRVLQEDYPSFDYGNLGIFLTNHDMPRVMSQFGGDAAKARLAAFLMLTAPGTPYIYYGEEIGMLGQKPDELIRTPMQWSHGAILRVQHHPTLGTGQSGLYGQ